MKRNSIGMAVDILRLVEHQELPITQVMSRCGLAWNLAKPLVERLCERGLLVKRVAVRPWNGEESRATYRTSIEGKALVKTWDELLRALGEPGASG